MIKRISILFRFFVYVKEKTKDNDFECVDMSKKLWFM